VAFIRIERFYYFAADASAAGADASIAGADASAAGADAAGADASVAAVPDALLLDELSLLEHATKATPVINIASNFFIMIPFKKYNSIKNRQLTILYHKDYLIKYFFINFILYFYFYEYNPLLLTAQSQFQVPPEP